MENNQLEIALSILKKKIDELGHSTVAVELGYRSEEAIKKWIYRNKVPITAITLILKLWGDKDHETDTEG